MAGSRRSWTADRKTAGGHPRPTQPSRELTRAHGRRFNRWRSVICGGNDMSIAVRVGRDFRRALLGCVVTLALALPALGQSNADERWAATWATALVVRPPAPPPAPATPAAPAAPAAPPAAAAS